MLLLAHSLPNTFRTACSHIHCHSNRHNQNDTRQSEVRDLTITWGMLYSLATYMTVNRYGMKRASHVYWSHMPL